MRFIPAIAAGLTLLAAPGLAAASVLVVDRGLPTANLNNAAGSNRSNVAWDEGAPTPYPSFDGDSFTLPGGIGAVYSINTIRTWVVTGAADLGDRFSSVTLYTGAGSTLSATASANFIGPGSNATSNANVTIAPAQYNGGVGPEVTYQGSSGSYINMFEVDFTGLNIVAPGGTTISFGVDGVGTSDPFWFTHASNAGLSGSPQDGSDGLLTCYTVSGSTASSCGTFSTLGNGWDKVSDLNVQVLATVPEPASLAILAGGLLGLGLIRRRR